MNIYNDFPINLNGADPSLITVKCKNGQIKITNDSLYQIYFRNADEDEMKVKLYYKNLPVDIYMLPLVQALDVNITIDGNRKESYTFEELQNLKLIFNVDDSFLNEKGLQLHSYRVTALPSAGAKNKDANFMVMNSPDFANIKRYIQKMDAGQKLLITEVRMRNNLNQVLNCQSGYFEILIK